MAIGLTLGDELDFLRNLVDEAGWGDDAFASDVVEWYGLIEESVARVEGEAEDDGDDEGAAMWADAHLRFWWYAAGRVLLERLVWILDRQPTDDDDEDAAAALHDRMATDVLTETARVARRHLADAMPSTFLVPRFGDGVGMIHLLDGTRWNQHRLVARARALGLHLPPPFTDYVGARDRYSPATVAARFGGADVLAPFREVARTGQLR